MTDLVKHFPVTLGVVVRRQVAAVHAVDGVSFSIRKGETLGLVGESGSGKSTTAWLVLRLIEPTSGRVELEGQDITAASGAQLRRARQEMQMIFQDPYASLDPRMTVRDIVGEPLVVWGRWRNGGPAQVAELLERVGLNPDHANRFPHEFSGGQRQRIGIARALTLRPKLIVCDELYRRPLHPYTQALVSAVPIPDPTLERQRKRIVLGGEIPSPTDPPSGCRFRTRCVKAQEICAQQEPELVDRGHGHPAACHFAEPLDVMH